MTEDREYEAALKRVRDIRKFWVHFATYVVVNAGLFAIDALDRDDGWWFFWSLLGWGFAVAIHAATIFIGEGMFGAAWEERKAQEILERRRDAGPK